MNRQHSKTASCDCECPFWSVRIPVAHAGPLASALIEAAAQYPEVDLLDLDAVEKAEIAAKDRMLAACGSREIFRPTQGKEDMKARTLL